MVTASIEYYVPTGGGDAAINGQCSNIDKQSTYHGSDWYSDATKRANWNYSVGLYTSWAGAFSCTTHQKGHRIYYGISSIGSGTVQKYARLKIDGVVKETVNLGSVSSAFGYFTWGTVKETLPTYLETLDKLDQWSSAQYIPSRNELNL